MADHLIDSTGLSGSRRGSGLLGLVVVLIAWGAILFSFRTQVRMVLDAWDTLPSHEHGYVVLVVVAYLLWSKLPVLRGEYCRPSWKGFAALVLTGFLAMLGELVSVAAVVLLTVSSPRSAASGKLRTDPMPEGTWAVAGVLASTRPTRIAMVVTTSK